MGSFYCSCAYMMTAVHYGPSFKLVHDQTERRYRELLEVSVGRLGMVLLIFSHLQGTGIFIRSASGMHIVTAR